MVQEQEQRQREILDKLRQEQAERERREKLAQAKIDNARGLQSPDTIFGPVPDFEEKRRPITRLFFSVYDNLGVLMAINVFTFLFTLPLLYVLVLLWTEAGRHKPVAGLLPLLVVGVIAPPAWAAASSYCAKIVEEQMHSLREFWSDYRRFLGKSILLAVGQWAIGVMLLYASGWYLTQPAPALRIVGIVSLYAFVLWAMAGLYVWPLMVRGYGWRPMLRNSAVLAIASPLRSIGLLIVLFVLTIILGITGIGLVVLAFGLWAMLPNQALVLTRERLERRRK